MQDNWPLRVSGCLAPGVAAVAAISAYCYIWGFFQAPAPAYRRIAACSLADSNVRLVVPLSAPGWSVIIAANRPPGTFSGWIEVSENGHHVGTIPISSAEAARLDYQCIIPGRYLYDVDPSIIAFRNVSSVLRCRHSYDLLIHFDRKPTEVMKLYLYYRRTPYTAFKDSHPNVRLP